MDPEVFAGQHLSPSDFSQETREPEQGKATTPADTNWRYFWANHLGTWKGRWTRYTPSGEVVETFTSSRDFRGDPSLIHIRQVNSYLYAGGRTVERNWSFNRSEHSQSDGFLHPESAVMRGLAFSKGAAAWLVPELEQDASAGLELFLMDGTARHSVGLVYDKDRRLVRTASIREDQRGYPGAAWSEDIEQGPPWDVSGQWKGVTETIRPDLSRSNEHDSELTWPMSANREHYFPDTIVLSCPPELPSDAPFAIAVLWQSGSDRLQTILVSYDMNPRMSTVKHQRLRAESLRVV